MPLSAPGVRYGPPGTKRLVYFVDDMNMPFVDKYDTQSAIELMRQSIDYRGWFDKALLRPTHPSLFMRLLLRMSITIVQCANP